MIQPLLLVALYLHAPATNPSAGSSGPSTPAQALSSWRREHGRSWQVETDSRTGFGRFLYGGSAPATSRPATDADFRLEARAAIRATRAIHGIAESTLVDDEVAFLPLGLIGSSDKLTVRFRQAIDGTPVEGGFANVLLATDGTLLSVDTTGVPELSAFDTTPALDDLAAAALGAKYFAEDSGLAATRVGFPELVIDPVERIEGGRKLLLPLLAWKVDVQAALPQSDVEGFVYYVDARDGARLGRRASVHHFDVSGTIRANVSPGVLPDMATNPPAPEGMRYMTVTSSAGDVQTDSAGNFNIPGANPPVSLTVQFSGEFADVLNAAGGRHVVNAVATQNTGNDVLMNDQSIATITAEGNAYNWINRLRDFVRSVNPTDSHGDFLASANVNLPAPCNAFYDGISVNFFIETTCRNSAYSTVIVHEMGHWLNDQYGSGNGSDGFGEGNGDVYAMYIVDDHIVARNFEGNGYIRNGENLRQFCGDDNVGCYGEVHTDGEVLMGALWKVRKHLKETNGTAAGGAIANALFFAWMNAYDDSQIRSIIEPHWLTLDDDNGNLSDGTPHYPDINLGFVQQGFPGYNIVTCPEPTIFCVAAANSYSMVGATMDWAGSTDVSQNDLVLKTYGIPPNRLCLYIYAMDQSGMTVFGNGFRCINSPIYRIYPAVHSDAAGQVVYPLDLNALPAAGAIGAGDSWGFTCWYRDGAAGGARFNASEGLSTTWCP